MKGEHKLRNMKVTTESGKDIRDTEKLSGHATRTSAEKATNETMQYTTGSVPKGPGGLGGHNTNS